MLPSSDTQIAKDNATDNISRNYSYGIKIEIVKEIPSFFKTKSGVLYDTKIYNIPYSGKKATLDDIGEYLKKMLKK